jgi:hypothetical protein
MQDPIAGKQGGSANRAHRDARHPRRAVNPVNGGAHPHYRGTSLMRKRTPLGLYTAMTTKGPMVILGGRAFSMEVPTPTTTPTRTTHTPPPSRVRHTPARLQHT